MSKIIGRQASQPSAAVTPSSHSGGRLIRHLVSVAPGSARDTTISARPEVVVPGALSRPHGDAGGSPSSFGDGSRRRVRTPIRVLSGNSPGVGSPSKVGPRPAGFGAAAPGVGGSPGSAAGSGAAAASASPKPASPATKKRVDPGTRAEYFHDWPMQHVSGMRGAFAIQQYLQQLIRACAARFRAALRMLFPGDLMYRVPLFLRLYRRSRR